jgi:drug/metabolite transporter (DMT)-like permease
MAQPAEMSRPAAHALLQVTVVLWGLTAILGRLISITAIPLVWYRLVIVLVVMALLRGRALRLPWSTIRRYALPGALIGVHWLCFYGAIKQAGVATAVLTLSTNTFFTALLEPVVRRRRIAGHEVMIGALVVVGVALLIRLELRAEPWGLALGFGSALFSAAFGVLNGVLAREERPERLLFYEMLAAALTVSVCFAIAPATFVAPWHLTLRDAGLLGVLAILCTVIPQLWVLRVLRVLSSFTVSVSVTLEPVYSLLMLLAFFPDAEPLSWRFYAGAGTLIALVMLDEWVKRRA